MQVGPLLASLNAAIVLASFRKLLQQLVSKHQTVNTRFGALL